jgi:hypothetical protein
MADDPQGPTLTSAIFVGGHSPDPVTDSIDGVTSVPVSQTFILQ